MIYSLHRCHRHQNTASLLNQMNISSWKDFYATTKSTQTKTSQIKLFIRPTGSYTFLINVRFENFVAHQGKHFLVHGFVNSCLLNNVLTL